MNVIFLDIDGVLIPNNYHDKDNLNINNDALKFLKKIINETNSKVVLISNWRFFRDEENDTSYKRLIKLLNDCGIYIYDIAPILKLKMIKKNNKIGFDPYTMRSGEIYKWLSDNDVDNFVILDDENYSYEFFGYDKNLILIDNKKGLTEEDVQKSIDILNNNKKVRG